MSEELRGLFEELSNDELASVLRDAAEVGDEETAKLAASVIASRKPRAES